MIAPPRDESSPGMDRALRSTRLTVAAAAVLLVPAAIGAAFVRVLLVVAILDAAVLAVATAYAFYLGLYRHPR